MERNEIINKIGTSEVTAEDVVKAIREKLVTFEELQETGDFKPDKRKRVKEILKSYEAEENAFNSADTLSKLEEFLIKYPNSVYAEEVHSKVFRIKEEQERERIGKIEAIKRNINNYTPDELRKELGESFLRDLCQSLRIDYEIVAEYDEPELRFCEIIPESLSEIPPHYTDVFFWGIETSGKSCALSAILSTISKRYVMDEAANGENFGGEYRDSLVEIFEKSDIGYLPASTSSEQTQYMSFLLRRRGEKENKSRKISFFELSGEVFRYFPSIVRNTPLAEKNRNTRAFRTLELLLSSDNQKIHFFFIDYNQAVQKSAEQEKSLKAAAAYFRDNDIFSKKTDAVYVVVTKADEISGGDKITRAEKFLADNFGDFMSIVQSRCKANSVNFDTKIFSIGDVYFSKICKINRDYAVDIIEDLLDRIKPAEAKWKKYLKS